MLTPDERRGARVLLMVVIAGALWDVSRAWRPAMAPPLDASSPLASPRAAAPAAPTPESAPVGGPAGLSRAPARDAASDTLDLNRASESELESLPGIGPVLARRICEHRQTEGPFRSVEELRAVRGVGPRLLERVRGRLRVSSG